MIRTDRTITTTTLLLMALLASLMQVEEAQSQDLLTLEEAVSRALEFNHGIRLARSEAEIGAVNRSLGEAGFLPSIDVTGSTGTVDEVLWTESEGEVPVRETPETDLMAVDIALNWTLFDGLRMFTSYRRLTELQRLGETEARIQIENTITDVIEAYYRIVREQQLLEVMESSIAMSGERVRIAETKRELGSGSDYEVLLAQTDLNADQAAAIRQEVVVNDATLRLMHLLDMDHEATFHVVNEIELGEMLQYEELHADLLQYNQELMAADLRASVARLELNQVRKERLPEVELNLGYGAYREQTRTLSPFLEEQAGFHYGITARLNLFDGFSNRRRSQIAMINRKNSEILLDETQKELDMLLRSEFRNYSNIYRLVELERENLVLAERALEIAFERFRLATITSVEFRETQRVLLDTESRLITALYETRISEAELMRIGGRLGLELLDREG